MEKLSFIQSLGLILLVFAGVGWFAAEPRAKMPFHEGKLLVADPKMPDPRFTGTIIFLCRHSANGAFGLILNRPAGMLSLSDLSESLRADETDMAQDIPFRVGGPVQIETGFLMYPSPEPDPKQICSHRGVAVSGHRDVVRTLMTE